MTRCCVKGCKSYSMKKESGISFHRFPKNEKQRNKWIHNVAKANQQSSFVLANHKLICSLHFCEDCFNRTMDVVRLRETSVPTIFPYNMKKVTIAPSPSREVVMQQTVGVSSLRIAVLPTTHKEVREDESQQTNQPSTSTYNNQFSETKTQQATNVADSLKIEKLASKVKSQKRQIKTLREKVRRQAKSIGSLKTIIDDLKSKNYVLQASPLLEESTGHKEFLYRQVLNSKGMPLPKEFNEDIRKFAVTLHFLSPKAYSFVRKSYSTCLPHPRTLTKWYQHTDAEPECTAESFPTFKIKVEASETPLPSS